MMMTQSTTIEAQCDHGKRSGQPGEPVDFLSSHNVLDLANCGLAAIASFGFESMASFKVKEVGVLVTGMIPNI